MGSSSWGRPANRRPLILTSIISLSGLPSSTAIAVSRLSPAPALIQRGKRSSSRHMQSKRARTSVYRSFLITTSRRRKGFTGISARSPKRWIFPRFCITFPPGRSPSRVRGRPAEVKHGARSSARRCEFRTAARSTVARRAAPPRRHRWSLPSATRPDRRS